MPRLYSSLIICWKKHQRSLKAGTLMAIIYYREKNIVHNLLERQREVPSISLLSWTQDKWPSWHLHVTIPGRDAHQRISPKLWCPEFMFWLYSPGELTAHHLKRSSQGPFSMASPLMKIVRMTSSVLKSSVASPIPSRFDLPVAKGRVPFLLGIVSQGLLFGWGKILYYT